MKENQHIWEIRSRCDSVTLPLSHIGCPVSSGYDSDDSCKNADQRELEYGKKYTKTHEDGWTISGEIVHDWYLWVKNFKATHPEYGYLYGDYRNIVYSESEKAYQHFLKHHYPDIWDHSQI